MARQTCFDEEIRSVFFYPFLQHENFTSGSFYIQMISPCEMEKSDSSHPRSFLVKNTKNSFLFCDFALE